MFVSSLMLSLLLAGQSLDVGPSNASAETREVFVSRGAVIIPKTEQFDITSKAGRAYRIFVAAPIGPQPEAGYPVIYVLDANACFSSFVEATRMQARRSSETDVSDAIIVGLGYPIEGAFDNVRRTYDYMSAASSEKLPPMRGGRTWPTSGGNEEFFQFIEGVVKPQIAKQFHIDEKRQSIFGHSFGGYFVLDTLFRHPDAYQCYIAASPSTWWNDFDILKTEQEFEAATPSSSSTLPTLMLSEGTSETGGPASQLAPTSNSTSFGSLQDLAGRINQSKRLSTSVRFHTFTDANHGATLNLTLQQAIPFALK